MTGPAEGDRPDPWRQLAVYRQRYDIEEHLEPVLSLQRSVERRSTQVAAERKRLDELEKLTEESRTSLGTLEAEIAATRSVGALLIEDILQRVRIEHREGWSPTPIMGYRMWWIRDNRMQGAQMPWDTPVHRASCLKRVPGEDLPHSARRCGTPACGVYATKGLMSLEVQFGPVGQTDSAFGVVALTGKVIEHAEAYRAAMARVVVLCVSHRGRHLLTREPELIERVFADPGGAIDVLGRDEEPAPDMARELLTRWKHQEDRTWT